MSSILSTSLYSSTKANPSIVMANRRYKRRRNAPDTPGSLRSSRRTRRRDRTASSQYRPCVVSSDSAMRGVQSRLFGGVLTALLTLGCIAFVLTASSITMGVTFAFTIGTYSLAASIALLMSARQEELIHQPRQITTDQHITDTTQKLSPQQRYLQEPTHASFWDDADFMEKRVKPTTSGHNATDGRL